METLETLTERIATMGDIKDIVRTMKSLSAASIRQFEIAAASLDTYRATVEMGLQVALRDTSLASLPSRPASASGLIVIGSDRGLCGRFNRRVSNLALEYIHEGGREIRVCLAIGARVSALLESGGHAPDAVFPAPGSARAIARTAQDILIHLDRLRKEGVGTIHVVSNHRRGDTRSQTEIAQLAPIPEPELRRLSQLKWRSRTLPMFTMERSDLLQWLSHEWLFVGLQRAIAASLASEHAARLSAMQAAERNIDERLDEVRQQARLARQNAITTELQDIMTGYQASLRADPSSCD